MSFTTTASARGKDENIVYYCFILIVAANELIMDIQNWFFGCHGASVKNKCLLLYIYCCMRPSLFFHFPEWDSKKMLEC